ncbi:hypothetical protein [Kyrpidia sp.]|uniref:hypothetical protein n=1 Tax=Kyrpidia sp. TaxID=2073077 RepID=UPI0017C7C4AE|nr:hypothetical protein [Kyrpidia sp.]MCL6575653.1 DUF1048 domain-containing protein [Kyrpidia sp.]HHY66920.1 hypothetical protein [Alicyclobacillus sp.]
MDEQTRKRIDRVVLECEVFWLLRRIPRTQVEVMKTELEEHLYDAAEDGKLVEDVVGEDVNQFADEWAKAVQARRSVSAKIKDGLYVLLVAASVVIPFKHIMERRGTVWFSWADVVLIVAIGAAIRLILSPQILVPGKGRSWKRGVAVSALILALAAIPGIPVYYAATHRLPVGIVQWPWYASLFLLIVTWIYSRWVLRTDVTAPIQSPEQIRRKYWRNGRIVGIYTVALLAVGIWWWRATGTSLELASGMMTIVGILWWTKLLTWSKI